MYLQYGSYIHAAQEARVSIRREALRREAADPYALLERWEITGRLVADDAAALSVAIANLESAYSFGGSDLKLLLPDGVTPSAHQLLSANCRGGTKIAQPVSYLVGEGAEYSTYRTYSLAIEGEVPIAARQNPIVSWHESLAFSGNGGPRFVVIETRNGSPQMQLVSQRTPVSVAQSGRAVGYSGWPFPPEPIWPQYEQVAQRQISLEAPRTSGSGPARARQEYAIAWSYTFLAPIYLAGFPHSQP